MAICECCASWGFLASTEDVEEFVNGHMRCNCGADVVCFALKRTKITTVLPKVTVRVGK